MNPKQRQHVGLSSATRRHHPTARKAGPVLKYPILENALLVCSMYPLVLTHRSLWMVFTVYIFVVTYIYSFIYALLKRLVALHLLAMKTLGASGSLAARSLTSFISSSVAFAARSRSFLASRFGF